MQALAQQPPSDGRSRTTPTTILMVDYHRTFVDLLATGPSTLEDAAHLGARQMSMWTGVTALMPFVACRRIGHSKELGKGSVHRVHSNDRRSAVCVI